LSGAAPGGYKDAMLVLSSPPAAVETVDVGALLVTADGRYLMQLRDDLPHIRVPGRWGLFGGGIDTGETPEQALRRELAEELGFRPTNAAWFHEVAMTLPPPSAAVMRKTFFEIVVTDAEVKRMELREGRAMRLFTPPRLLAQPRLVAWDVGALLLHAHRHDHLPPDVRRG